MSPDARLRQMDRDGVYGDRRLAEMLRTGWRPEIRGEAPGPSVSRQHVALAFFSGNGASAPFYGEQAIRIRFVPSSTLVERTSERINTGSWVYINSDGSVSTDPGGSIGHPVGVAMSYVGGPSTGWVQIMTSGCVDQVHEHRAAYLSQSWLGDQQTS